MFLPGNIAELAVKDVCVGGGDLYTSCEWQAVNMLSQERQRGVRSAYSAEQRRLSTSHRTNKEHIGYPSDLLRSNIVFRRPANRLEHDQKEQKQQKGETIQIVGLLTRQTPEVRQRQVHCRLVCSLQWQEERNLYSAFKSVNVDKR